MSGSRLLGHASIRMHGRLARRRLTAGSAAIATTLATGALAGIALAPPAAAANAYQYFPQNGTGAGTCSAAGTYVVPAGVTLLDITAYGQDGRYGSGTGFGLGGLGGKVVARVAVTPGETLWVAPNSLAVAGGTSNSSRSGGNGSLLSSVDPATYCGTHPAMPVSDVLVVAGGGGGGADGGYDTGGSGGAAGWGGGDGGSNTAADGGGGGAGTQTAGGAGGAQGKSVLEFWGVAGASGQYLTGGNGGNMGAAPNESSGQAAGGGGGFFGGGGGGGGAQFAAFGGGGGGSNYVSPSDPSTYPADTPPGVIFSGFAENGPEIDITPVYASTTASVHSAMNPVPQGSQVRLSTIVTLSDGSHPGYGVVDFYDGSTIVGTGGVSSSTGSAAVSVSFATQGAHNIRAMYDGIDRPGDQHDAASWAADPQLTQQVGPPLIPPVVTLDPQSSARYYPNAGSFSAAAHSLPAPTVQWQESTDGGLTFTDIPGATSSAPDTSSSIPGEVTSDVQIPDAFDLSGNQVRAVFSNALGAATTSAATMTVLRAPITFVANDISVFPGSAVPPLTFSYPVLQGSVADEVTTPPTCTTTATSSSPAGSYPIACDGAVTPNYIPTYQDGTYTVDPTSQRTAFDIPAAATGWLAGDWITLSAVGGVSGNPVAFSIDPATPPGLCSLDGSTLMLATAPAQAGDCLVTATQPGVAQSIAPPVTLAVHVNLPIRAATLTVPATGAVTGSDVLSATGYTDDGDTYTVTSSIAITPAPSDAGICSLSTAGGVTTVSYLGVGNCVVHAQQPQGAGRAAGTTQLIAVNPATAQTITFSLPTSARAGDLATTLTGTGGGSGSPVVFSSDSPTVCSVAGTTLTFLAQGTCSVTADQAASPGYAAAAPTTHSVAVLAGIVFNPPATGVAGQSDTLTAIKVPLGRPPVTYALGASSGAGVCSLSGSNNAQVSYLAVGSCVVTASQASIPGIFIGPPNVTRTIQVLPGTQTVAFTSTPPANAVAGGSYSPTFTRTTTSLSPAVLATTSLATICTLDPVSNQVSFTGAGTCTLTLDQAANSSYSAAPQVTQDIVVTSAEAAVTIVGTQLYAGSPSFSATTDVPGVTATSVSCTATTTATISSVLTVGTYPLDDASCTATLSNPAYTPTYSGSFTVSPGLIAVTVTGSQSYGGTASFNATTDVDGVTATSVVCTETTTVAIAPTLAVGAYTLDGSSCSASLPNPNYTPTYVGAAFTVSPGLITVTVTGSQTYGGSPTFTAVTDVPGVTAGAATCTNVSAGSSINVGLDAGSYALEASTCSATVSDPNYNPAYAGGAFTVNKRTVTVAASDGSMSYGGTIPTITPSFSGFANGQNESVLSTPVACSPNVSVTTPAGTYLDMSTCAGGVAANYAFTYIDGTVTIDRAPATVTVVGSQTYGSGSPVFTATTNIAGLTASAASCAKVGATTISATLPVGAYALNTTTCTATLSDANYAASYVGGFTVARMSVVVTASDGSMTYGGTPAAITALYGPLANGQTSAVLTTQPSCVPNVIATTPAGTYLNRSTCVGAAAANYAFTYVNGKVTIAAKVLTVTASSVSARYGTVPAVTPTYTGFVNGDTVATLHPAPTCTSNTTTTTVAGAYAGRSSCAGALAANYIASYVNGTVTITPARVRITSTATSEIASLKARHMTFTSTVINLDSGAPVAGVAVTVTIVTGVTHVVVTCTATTNSAGVATCVSTNANLLGIKTPQHYTTTTPATNNYLAGSGTGAITLM